MIEPGRHKHVDLRGNDRKRKKRCAEHREFQLGHEVFEQRGVNEFRVFRACYPDEWPYKDIVDVLCENEAEGEHRRERDQRLDQPRAQLDQVIHQRRLGGLDIFVRHDLAPAC